MASETFVVESNLSPAAAFNLVIDLTRVGEWDEGIKGSRLAGGEAGSVGARYEVDVVGFDGQPTTAVYELTAVNAAQTFTMVGTHPAFRATDIVTFAETSNGCDVTYEAELVLLGENPPMSEAQLAKLFAKIVAVPRDGLASFLNE